MRTVQCKRQGWLACGRLWWLCLALLLAGCPKGEPESFVPESIGEVGPWSLTDQDGKPFGSSELKGKPYVVSFFFTYCQTVCPKLLRAMRAVQRELKGLAGKVHYVSITVDPENDTPQRLREFAKTQQADHRQWTFLTADEATLRAVVTRSLLHFVGEASGNPKDGSFHIGHGGELMLVDGDAGIRGRYETTPEGLERLKAAIRGLTGS